MNNDNITTEVVGSLNEGKWAKKYEQSRRVYGTDGLAPTIHSCGGRNIEPKVLVSSMRFRVDNNEQTLEVTAGKRENTQNYVKEIELINGTDNGCDSTLTTGHDSAKHITEPKGGHKQMGVKETTENKIRIRKLTERECFRLMGVEDSDIDKIQAANISKTQQYKMAGNSIVVDVLYHIFRKMFVETEADGGVQLEIF